MKFILHISYKLEWIPYANISTAVILMQPYHRKMQLIFREHKYHCCTDKGEISTSSCINTT